MPGADFIIRTGDQALFNPAFTPAVVNVLPGIITGTGGALIDGTIGCVLGDEASVIVPGVMYVSPPFVIPGAGTLTIAALAPDQIAKRTQFLKKPVILKGALFNALFTVSFPASQPQPTGPPIPDPRPVYNGNGQFASANFRLKGS